MGRSSCFTASSYVLTQPLESFGPNLASYLALCSFAGTDTHAEEVFFSFLFFNVAVPGGGAAKPTGSGEEEPGVESQPEDGVS